MTYEDIYGVFSVLFAESWQCSRLNLNACLVETVAGERVEIEKQVELLLRRLGRLELVQSGQVEQQRLVHVAMRIGVQMLLEENDGLLQVARVEQTKRHIVHNLCSHKKNTKQIIKLRFMQQHK